MRPLKAVEVLDQTPISQPCISIYIPQRKTQAKEKKQVRLKNLLRSATQLITKDFGSPKANEIIGSIEETIFDVSFRTNERGLGFFISSDVKGYVPFPLKGKDLVVVANSFHTKPLIRWLQDPNKFFLTTLSQKQIKLYHGTQTALNCIESFKLDIPKSQNETYRRGRAGIGKGLNITETINRQIKGHYLIKQIQEIRESFMSHLNHENSPMVIAGPKTLRDLYKSELIYPYLVPEEIDGTMDHFSNKKLHEKVSEIISRLVEVEHRRIRKMFQETESLNSIVRIAKASVEGRIDKLLIAEDQHLWGTFNSKTGSLKINPKQMNSKDDDLLDDLSEQTLRCKGDVYVLPTSKMPGKSYAYAMLRW